jgi:hypothetical protein
MFVFLYVSWLVSLADINTLTHLIGYASGNLKFFQDFSTSPHRYKTPPLVEMWRRIGQQKNPHACESVRAYLASDL